MIIYATGFDAMLGGFKKIEIEGTRGRKLADEWKDETRTYLGVMKAGFPNMLMVAGPQSVSGSTNYPPAIESGVEWITRLLVHAREAGVTRLEASQSGEDMWTAEVAEAQERTPFAKVQSWFTGYSPNISGAKAFRYNAYWAGAPKYRKFLAAAEDGYPEISMS